MLLSKGFLAWFTLSFGKNSYFLFGDPQRGLGSRLNLLTHNQGNPGAASDTRGYLVKVVQPEISLRIFVDRF